jgi:type I restriction enzyme R subunit
MWLTGFDAPTVSTLYLDKPSIGHTLMQTIARANRTTDWLDVFGRGKEYGKIVAYCNVFGNLKKALTVYGDDMTEVDKDGEQPEGECQAAMTPEDLYKLLRQTINECVAWCTDYDVNLESILKKKTVFSKIDEFQRYADILLNPTDRRAQFNVYDNTVSALYNELQPEILKRKSEFEMADVIHYLLQVMDNNIDRGNMDIARMKATRLLDISIVPKEKVHMAAEEIPRAAEERKNLYPIKVYKEYDLTLLDYDKMREEFKNWPHKNMEIRDLSEFIGHKLEQMLSQNGERRSFAERFQDIIIRYNSSSDGAEQAFEELTELIRQMSEEQQRASREELSEDELEMFDILKKDKMTKDETIQVKNGARTLLAKMKEKKTELFPQFWYKESSLQRKVYIFIGDELDNILPPSYDRVVFTEKKERMYQQVLQRACENRMFA